MGVYDIVSFPGTPVDGAQVKLWTDTLHHYEIGDRVPKVFGKRTYGVVLREGGVALITDLHLMGWQAELPTDLPLFDKWGGSWNEDVNGSMGENYFWGEKDA